MKSYSRFHLSDRALLALGASRNTRINTEIAAHVADIAEIEKRKLHHRAGYQSMADFLEIEWKMSRDEAYRRIHAARAALEYPVIFAMLADGRLHLSGVNLLAPRLTRANANQLLNAAVHKTKAEIEELLAERYPTTETMALVETYSIVPRTTHSSPVDSCPKAEAQSNVQQMSPSLVPGRVNFTTPKSSVVNVAQGRVAFTLTMSQDVHEKLRHAADLLSHRVPSGDLAEVIEQVLDLAIPALEKQKFSATDTPRAVPKASWQGRRVPADVRRSVWKRDEGRCTFVGDTGHRCDGRRFLEFDHIVPVARGGESTLGNVRLRCRAHNQLEAENMFGAEFMKVKRESAAAVR